MILLGILAIAFGLLIIVARDFFWSLTELSNSFAGRQSERTELWEAGQIISGVVLVLIGVAVLCMGITETSQAQARDTAATATAATELQDVSGAFARYLTEWQTVEGRGIRSVDPRSLSIEAEAIYYGRCRDDQFFVVVAGFNDRYRTYGYFPEAEPDACSEDGIVTAFVSPIGQDWYRFSLLDWRITATPAAQEETVPTATPQSTQSALDRCSDCLDAEQVPSSQRPYLLPHVRAV